MDTSLLPDDYPITLTWSTTAIDEYSREFTLGELREALRGDHNARNPLPLDITGELATFSKNWLVDYADKAGFLVEFTREITDNTDISLPVLPVHTVTIAGPERHDGEKPYTYCLRAADLGAARALALAYHIEQNELMYDWATGGQREPDAIVIEGDWDTFTGTPAWPADLPGRAWHDLREDEDLLTRAYTTGDAR